MFINQAALFGQSIKKNDAIGFIITNNMEKKEPEQMSRCLYKV